MNDGTITSADGSGISVIANALLSGGLNNFGLIGGNKNAVYIENSSLSGGIKNSGKLLQHQGLPILITLQSTFATLALVAMLLIVVISKHSIKVFFFTHQDS